MKRCSIIIFCAAAALAWSPLHANLTDGLIGYWPLDNLSANDESGNALHGVIDGPIDVGEDRFGNPIGAMAFPGTNEAIVDLGDGPEFNLSGAMTAAAWIWMDGTNVDNGRVISKQAGSGSRSWSLNVEGLAEGGGRGAFMVSGEGASVTIVEFAEPLPTDEWVHLTGVYRPGNSLELFVNGELVALEDFPIPDEQFSDNAQSVLIGNRHACTNCSWFGLLDDVALWDRDLSAAEVSDLFTRGLGGGPSVPGDFNANGVLDSGDLNLLAAAVRSMSSDRKFDLNVDGKVNDADHLLWIKDPKFAHTYVGDADLNGEFQSGDFVKTFLAGKYETPQPAGWEEGDWDGNGTFGSADFVAAFLDGGYELGPRPAIAVPEPTSATILSVTILAFGVRLRRLSGRM